MQVFRLFFKLIKNTSAPIILLTAVFVLYVFLLMDKGYNNSVESEGRINLAVLNYNKDDALWRQLKSILENYCSIYDYEDDEELLDDKLTTLNIDAVIFIPYGFSQDILSGKKVVLELQKLSDNRFLTYMEDIINLYLNTAQLYSKEKENDTPEHLAAALGTTFEINGEYKQLYQRDTLINYKTYEKYFRFASYVVFTVCLLGIGMAQHSIQNIHIQRRNLMSPLPDKFLNFQMFFGNLIFVVLYDVFLIIISLIYYSPRTLDVYILCFWINLIVFSLSCLSMSFLMAMLTKKREVNIVLAILLPLILCFISGVFSSQDNIGEGLLSIAYFTPTYWLVRGSTAIMQSGYGQVRLLNVIPVILTQSLFAAALFCIALMISKEKRNKS